MKIVRAAALVIVALLVVAFVTLRVTGLAPKERRPGLWLKGDLVTTPVADWSFTDSHQEIQVETRERFLPLLAHSVTAFCVSYNGRLYLAAAYQAGMEYPHGKHWTGNVAADPRVRLKIGDALYEGTLTYVTDPAEKAGVIGEEAKKYPQMKVNPPLFHVFRVVPNV